MCELTTTYEDDGITRQELIRCKHAVDCAIIEHRRAIEKALSKLRRLLKDEAKLDDRHRRREDERDHHNHRRRHEDDERDHHNHRRRHEDDERGRNRPSLEEEAKRYHKSHRLEADDVEQFVEYLSSPGPSYSTSRFRGGGGEREREYERERGRRYCQYMDYRS